MTNPETTKPTGQEWAAFWIGFVVGMATAMIGLVAAAVVA